MRHLEKVIMLNVLDNYWKEHLATMDYVRQSIHLRGYAQKDPKQEYKREAFTLFTTMLDNIKREIVAILAKMQVQAETDVEQVNANMRQEATKLQFHHDQAETIISKPAAQEEHSHETVHEQPYVREQAKVGRNDPCPCGSGRKYKQCHGSISNVGA